MGQVAWRLLKGCGVEAGELRGVGIMVTKFEGADSGKRREGGGEEGHERVQKTLEFRARKDAPGPGSQEVEKGSSGRARTSSLPLKPDDDDNDDNDLEQEQQHEHEHRSRQPAQPSPPPPPRPSTPFPLALPSFSQVDISAFGALPTQLRAEITAEYGRRSASPARGALDSTMKGEGEGEEGEQKKGRGAKGGGVRTNKGTPLSRITQALAPRTRAGDARSGASASLVGAGSIFERAKSGGSSDGAKRGTGEGKGGVGTVIMATPAELERLGIDRDVLAALPREVQLEQLAAARFARFG